MKNLVASLLLLAASAAPGADVDYTDAMSREHAGDRPDASPAALAAPALPVTASRVTYGSVAGAGVAGWLARPKDAEKIRGALIVIHEWWGLNGNIRSMAEQLAGEGYAALAVDLYGGRSASTPQEARELMQAAMADRSNAEANLRAAYGYLTGELGAAQVASIGWCFGGAWSLNTALMFPTELDAAVIYYGRLVTDEALLAPIEVPLLGIFGALDQGIPVESVRAFEAALAALDKDAEIVVYDDADHAFANPSGQRYNPIAAADAWRRTRAFLAQHLEPASIRDR
jgi:carboxymethylenebutenolidase